MLYTLCNTHNENKEAKSAHLLITLSYFLNHRLCLGQILSMG